MTANAAQADSGGTILLLGNYRPAVAVARALAANGWRIMQGLEGEDLGADTSRQVDEIWNHPHLSDDSNAFLDSLLTLIRSRADVKAVLPVSEEFVNFLAGHDQAIREHTLLVSPQPEIVSTFSDKQTALDLAGDSGVSTLPYARVSDYRSLLTSADRIGFPLTIRAFGATARMGMKKALIVYNFAELTAELPEWPEGHEDLLLQRFASGTRHNVYFAAQDGQIVGSLETRITRTDHPEGTGLAVDGLTVASSEELLDATARLAAATHYTGIGLTQFIVSDDGSGHCFLELNPRVAGSHAVAEQAGLPLARMAVALAGDDTGQAVSGPEAIETITDFTEGREGLRYVWTGGDLLGAKHAFMRREISAGAAIIWIARALVAAAFADIRMVWSWRDPVPGLLYVFVFLPRCGKIGALLRSIATATKRRPVAGQPADDISGNTAGKTELMGGHGNA